MLAKDLTGQRRTKRLDPSLLAASAKNREDAKCTQQQGQASWYGHRRCHRAELKRSEDKAAFFLIWNKERHFAG